MVGDALTPELLGVDRGCLDCRKRWVSEVRSGSSLARRHRSSSGDRLAPSEAEADARPLASVAGATDDARRLLSWPCRPVRRAREAMDLAKVYVVARCCL